MFDKEQKVYTSYFELHIRKVSNLHVCIPCIKQEYVKKPALLSSHQPPTSADCKGKDSIPATQREVRLRERGKEVAIIAVLAGEGGCDQPN